VYYQFVPIFACVLGYFVLGESLTRLQLIAMVIILFGTTVITFEIDEENKFKFRRKAILPMVAASFCWALESVIFKAVALEENVWRSLFWDYGMLLLAGIVIFLLVRSYRNDFLSTIRGNSKAVLSLGLANEALYIGGNLAFALAYMLAPVALVLLTNSFQSLFVLIIGIFLTVFFPKVSVEKIKAKHIWQKVIAICITAVGTYLLFMK
jgi:drug/metabolite transporter (DMT)-like permease